MMDEQNILSLIINELNTNANKHLWFSVRRYSFSIYWKEFSVSRLIQSLEDKKGERLFIAAITEALTGTN